MRTKTINLYQFAELSDAAKEKARDWYRNASADDSFWSECALDSIAEVGALLGIEFARKHNRRAIWFSGFSSQGDGASYDGTWYARGCKFKALLHDYPAGDKSNNEIRRIASALGEIAGKYPESYATVSSPYRGHFLTVICEPGEGPESCGQCDSSQDCEKCNAADEWITEFPEDELTEALRDFAAWAYRLLESEYEYQNSDEQVGESITINEYEFTEEGERA